MDDYWELTPIQMAGVDRVGELLAQGRTEEARDHFISSARAVWTHRWASVRHYTLQRLGESLDAERFPELAEIALALRNETPGAASRFLEYLRARLQPNAGAFVQAPTPPKPDFDPAAGHNSFTLWNAWLATGDQRCKQALDERLAAFLHPTRVISWHETNYPWASLVCSAMHHGGIDDETLCKLILFGLDYAEHCNVIAHLSDPPQTSIGGNHVLYQILSWLTMMVLFPEFRRAPALLHAVVARLDDELSKQVMPDGSMIEGAPGYQNCCINLFGNLLTICHNYRVELPRSVHDRIEQLVRFNIGMMKPDGRIPMFGDSQDDVVKDLSQGMARHYSFPELRWLLTDGAEGQPPEFTSKAFDCIGYYVLRDGWSPDALCLAFDGGRFGQSHHHEDKLSFELCAYGRTFIVDPGIHSYSDHWMRQWLVCSGAHNVILIDGAGQCRWRQDREQWYSHLPLENRWETGETWDIVEAEFDGPYETPVGEVRQRRRIAFYKAAPRFWWITDIIDGEGDHEITELFHFDHQIDVVEPISGGVRTVVPGGPDLALLLLNDEGVEVQRFRAEMDPPRGWVSHQRFAVDPAWEAHFTGRAQLPHRRDFLLLPWPDEFPATFAADLDLDASRLTIRLAGEVYEIQGLPRSVDLVN